MDLTTQRRLASQVLQCSLKRVTFDPARLNDIKEAITKVDIKGLIKEKAITRAPEKGVSRGRARKAAAQKAKGLRKGKGSRKAKRTATTTKKEAWIKRVRIQRAFLKELKDKQIITPASYKSLYRKSKGGFFRSKRHIKLYVEENDLAIKRDSA